MKAHSEQVKKYQKKYKLTHKEKATSYYIANKERLLENGKKYHRANKKQINQRQKEYYRTHKEEFAQRQKARRAALNEQNYHIPKENLRARVARLLPLIRAEKLARLHAS